MNAVRDPHPTVRVSGKRQTTMRIETPFDSRDPLDMAQVILGHRSMITHDPHEVGRALDT